MGADILERLDFMLISRKSDEDAIIRDARAEIVSLRGEVAMTEQQKADRDLLLTGTSFMRDGKRIDPATVRIETPAPAMPNGVEASPANCRERLRLEGRPYPRSGCAHCKLGGLTGCPYEKGVHNSGRAADNRDAAGVDSKEDAYVIERMGKLLAEIAVIVNGPEPDMTRWSYHDLPEKVRALKTAPAAVPAGEAVAWLASDGEVFTDKESADRHSKVWGVNPLLTPLYTTPPAPVQSAPQEGEDAAEAYRKAWEAGHAAALQHRGDSRGDSRGGEGS